MYLSKQQKQFLSYVFTKQFLTGRFKVIDPKENYVSVPMAQIRKLFFSNPRNEIDYLFENGFLLTKSKTSKLGHDYKLYRTTQLHDLNFSTFEYDGAPLDKLTIQMRNFLQFVSINPTVKPSFFFQKFMELRGHCSHLFFKVDHFSGRVHTPITNMKRELRPFLLIKNKKTISLDIKTMQPLLLGKILEDKIGCNQFSEWINNGEDIYLILKDRINLPDRDAAKNKFYEIIFGQANNQLAKHFGNSSWIEWVNEFKTLPIPSNPNTEERVHTNLAHLLQTTEVAMMRKVWQSLIKNDIIFLSVHDEIITRESDQEETFHLMTKVLKPHFQSLTINTK